MLAAARGQVKSLRWRLTVGAIFATGAALVLESAAAGFGWYLVLALSMCFDYMLGNSYLEQRGQADRKTAGVLFVWGSLFSIAIYAAMPVALAALGGGPGRVLGVLIAASSLVSVMISKLASQRLKRDAHFGCKAEIARKHLHQRLQTQFVIALRLFCRWQLYSNILLACQSSK